MAFGEQLARLREQRRMSQVALARRAALSQSTISKLEAGARNPSLATMECLAAAFDLSLEQFIRALARAAPRSARR
jgi:transcriptional regulator with XRE-family HTH domain